MAPLQLIKLTLFSVFFLGSTLTMANTSCRDVIVKSNNVDKSETTHLCFMKDETYFISRNCQDMRCRPMKLLKEKRPEVSSEERPGIVICRELKGIIENITVSGSKLSVQRCLFPEEKVSVSLNLLESWDGKKFSGPSQPLGL